MTLIDLKPVRRCTTCGHLVPASHHACPYCSGQQFAVDERPAAPVCEQQQVPAPQTPRAPREPMSRGLKIGLIAAGAVAVLAIVAVVGIKMYSFNHILEKSIFEPLTQDEVAKLAEDDSDFREFYSQCVTVREELRTPEDREKFGTVTYKEMREFMNYFGNDVWLNEQRTKAAEAYETDVHQKIKPQLDSVVNKWQTYIDEHQIDKCIQVAVHTTYSSDGYYTHPGFYFTTNVLNSNIQEVDAYLETKYKDSEMTDMENKISLSDLQKYASEDHKAYWTHNYSSDFWDYRTCELSIRSITLTDGTVIDETGPNNVPQEISTYLDNKTEQTELAVIRTFIQTNYPSVADYQKDFINKHLKELDPLCFEMMNKVEKYGSASSTPSYSTTSSSYSTGEAEELDEEY